MLIGDKAWWRLAGAAGGGAILLLLLTITSNRPNRLHHLQSLKRNALNELQDALSTGEVVNFFMKSQTNGTTVSIDFASAIRVLLLQMPLTAQIHIFIPKEVAFECGGQDNADTCVTLVESCTDKADAYLSAVYKNDPFRATELRKDLNCQCFVSNGCSPSCNVALYMVWATGTGVQCPARPPVYLESIGAFQYGDPMVSNVMPSDISYDYFPEYPNPAGHVFDVSGVREQYRKDPRTSYRYPSSYKYYPWYYYDEDIYSPSYWSYGYPASTDPLLDYDQMTVPSSGNYFYDPYSGRVYMY
ncbi:hypothetical protein GUITHDRAFT_142441 [Guillardia theta CCMP2712]|uniref:Uncharacterized protein n=1 Tax=Guillardia theta (strain CCMP2712) TaxID=905079 RepID=L1IXK8_GUITC|nr:hypothetical protein GUITHDRAFT_142441 [Guillardia theta CCMP2712]EKX40807.1 hypothetical protein GUITHDRAFT_142441 [Guillardia theta CCMP2712]|eukprot:XP_005827787.1 hypothetical protein GUITHDRAFT_142441 [Guillardia theta CCMP2712]